MERKADFAPANGTVNYATPSAMGNTLLGDLIEMITVSFRSTPSYPVALLRHIEEQFNSALWSVVP